MNVDVRVVGSSDDAVQLLDGSNTITTTVLWHGDKSSHRYVGTRFLAVTIPVGATIDTAYLTWRAAATDTGNVRGDFHAEDSATPPAFNTNANDISGRTPTSATVPWDNPESWTNNNYYNSPEIKTVIQELVDTYDYSSGLAIAIIYKWDFGSPERGADSWDASSSDAPLLHIEYTAEAGGGGYEWSVEALDETGLSKVYCEAVSGGTIDTRRDITDEEDQEQIIADMKTAFPGSDVYYKHTHKHNVISIPCVREEI